MPSRVMSAADLLGVASLAFVGVGGYAAFTSNVSLNTSAAPGTFILGTTGYCAPPGTGTVKGVNNTTITTGGGKLRKDTCGRSLVSTNNPDASRRSS